MNTKQAEAVRRVSNRLEGVREEFVAALAEPDLPELYREMLSNLARRAENLWVASGCGGPVDTDLVALTPKPPTPLIGRVIAFRGDPIESEGGRKSPAAQSGQAPCGVCWGCGRELPAGYGGPRATMPLYCGACRGRGSTHGWCNCGSALYAGGACKPMSNESRRWHLRREKAGAR